MARTWFAGYPTGQTIPQSTKIAVRAATDYLPSYSESALFEEQVAVTFDPAMMEHQHQTTTPTKAVRPSGFESNGLVNRQMPFSSSPKTLTSQAMNASANSATLLRQQQHPKPNDTQQPVTYSVLPQRMTYQTLAPPSSLPPTPRAPTAQMLSQTSYAATNTSFLSSSSAAAAAAQTATPETASPFIPRPNPTMTPTAPTFASPIASAISLPPSSSSVLPFNSSSAVYPSITSVRKRKRGPEIGLTAAAAMTAPGASSNNTAVATVLQNTKILPHEKQQADNGGVRKKRPYIRRKPLVKKAETPGSITQGDKEEGEKRPRGRSFTRSSEQSSRQQNAHGANEQQWQQMFQHFWPPADESSHEDPDRSSNGTSSALSHKRQRRQPPTTQNNIIINGGGGGGGVVSHAILSCSEEPHSFPKRLEEEISLRRHSLPLQEKDKKPKEKTTHSKTVRACANHAAHKHHAHGVCTSCDHKAHQLFQAEAPQLLAPHWWPLCKACGQDEMRQAAQTGRKECPCNRWLCFECRMAELEDRDMKNDVETKFRRTIGGGHGDAVTMNWACMCGGKIEIDGIVTMKCVGCQAIRLGKVEFRETAVREKIIRLTGFASMS